MSFSNDNIPPVFISVEDAVKLKKLYTTCQEIASGKLLQVIVNGKPKSVNVLSIPTDEVLTLLEDIPNKP